jgi:ketosteroid isomerase-like protein
MVDGDVDALRSMCDPTLRYVLTTGEVENLESWLEKIRERRFRYDRIEHPVERVEIRGDLAVVIGRMHVFGAAEGTMVTLTMLTTSVLTRDGSSWRLLIFHATRTQ